LTTKNGLSQNTGKCCLPADKLRIVNLINFAVLKNFYKRLLIITA